MSKKGKVLMAMSGGIDSTVAALMLHKEGYEVVGITMKTWDYAASVGTTGKKETGCCNLDSFNDARQAAVQHGFPHFILDIRVVDGDLVVAWVDLDQHRTGVHDLVVVDGHAKDGSADARGNLRHVRIHLRIVG